MIMQLLSSKVFSIAVLLLASLVQPVVARASELSDIKALAEQGDAVAQDQLGNAYKADFNYATAAEWYRKSALQGNAHAQTELGHILIGGEPTIIKGQAVAANPPAGAGWFLKAANQDYIDAQYEVGKCYRDGKGVSADPVEAFKWFDLAAKKGYIMAKVYRDKLVLKLTSDQIAEGQRRSNQFKPNHAEEQFIERLQLKGISGPANRRLALINNESLLAGETVTIKIDGQPLTIHCIEIREKSVVVSVEGFSGNKELFLK
jgi:TPR repeat protein